MENKRFLGLSKSEQRVVDLLPLGNNEIAERLGLKVCSVKFHLWRASKKIGVKNRAELMLAMMKAKGQTI